MFDTSLTTRSIPLLLFHYVGKEESFFGRFGACFAAAKSTRGKSLPFHPIGMVGDGRKLLQNVTSSNPRPGRCSIYAHYADGNGVADAFEFRAAYFELGAVQT